MLYCVPSFFIFFLLLNIYMSKRHKREVGSSVHNSWGEVQWSKLRPYGVYILLRTHKSRSFVSALRYIELKRKKKKEKKLKR
jgi:hypothetical protein